MKKHYLIKMSNGCYYTGGNQFSYRFKQAMVYSDIESAKEAYNKLFGKREIVEYEKEMIGKV